MEPSVGRPDAPGYGFGDSPDGALPWSWAEEQIAKCRNFMVTSVRPDGRPHSMPVWGVFTDGLFVFSTAITSVKSKNLLKNPKCVVSMDLDHNAVIIEGDAKIIDVAEVPGFIDAYKQKYGQKLDPDKKWAVVPTVAFAFIEDDSFSKTATRWTF